MKFSANQIAAVIQGQVEGDGERIVQELTKIEEGKLGGLCFLSNPKYEPYLYKTEASVVIVNEDLVLKEPVNCTLVRVPDAYLAFSTLLQTYEQITKVNKYGIHPSAHIAETAFVGENVYLGPNVVIDEHSRVEKDTQIYANTYIGEHSKIGENCILYANVSVYHRCEIGNQCIIHSGAVIGSDGFGHAPNAQGSYQKIPQLGNVILESQVEIGANCCIDRATTGSTIIRQGVKLDNLIQIGHNASIGEHTVVAAQAGISGSTKIGAKNMIGGQAGVVGHIETAEGVKINAQSGLTKTIKTPNTAVTGSPAHEFTASLRSQSIIKKLPELEQRIIELEQKLEELKNRP